MSEWIHKEPKDRLDEISDLIRTASLKEDVSDRYTQFKEAELLIEVEKLLIADQFVAVFREKRMSFHG